MSQNHRARRYPHISVAVLVFGCSLVAQAQSFSDGFEGSSIDPYWTMIGPGTANLTAVATHSRTQSILLAENPNVFAYSVALQHDYAGHVSGTVSVWML